MMIARFCTLALFAAALAACSQQAPDEAESVAENSAAPAIEVENGWVRTTPGGNEVTAAYFTLANTGGADRLIAVSSDQLTNVELHATSADQNNVMRMQRLDGIDIPAGGEVAFAPGGNHAMLYGASDLALGDTVCLRLDFEVSEDQIACLPVMDDAPLE
jgi:copper(I)-binding protein